MNAVSATTAPPGTSVRSSGWAKVPALTAFFWIVKILTTGMGESASDYLAHWGIWVPGVL